MRKKNKIKELEEELKVLENIDNKKPIYKNDLTIEKSMRYYNK